MKDVISNYVVASLFAYLSLNYLVFFFFLSFLQFFSCFLHRELIGKDNRHSVNFEKKKLTKYKYPEYKEEQERKEEQEEQEREETGR